jgi:hypothetical protein
VRLQQRHLQRVEAQDAEAAEVALKEQAISRGRDGAHAQEETAKQELPVTCIAVSAGMSVVIDVSVERHIGEGKGGTLDSSRQVLEYCASWRNLYPVGASPVNSASVCRRPMPDFVSTRLFQLHFEEKLLTGTRIGYGSVKTKRKGE